MAGKTYKTRGIVLRKTKLAEKDLIVTVLDESGSLVRAVAKGARRPGGSYAARLELFSAVDLMLAQGRNLDVITSATFAGDTVRAPFGIEQAACASALAELLVTLAQEDLPHDRLYAMAKAAFGGIGASEPLEALKLACSALLKALAYAGFRPSFSECVLCGSRVALEGGGQVPFTVADGGVVCGSCRQPSDAMRLDAHMLSWADALMRSRFEDVRAFDVDAATLFAVLHLTRQWVQTHAGKNLKSLDFLFTSGLF